MRKSVIILLFVVSGITLLLGIGAILYYFDIGSGSYRNIASPKFYFATSSIAIIKELRPDKNEIVANVILPIFKNGKPLSSPPPSLDQWPTKEFILKITKETAWGGKIGWGDLRPEKKIKISYSLTNILDQKIDILTLKSLSIIVFKQAQ